MPANHFTSYLSQLSQTPLVEKTEHTDRASMEHLLNTIKDDLSLPLEIIHESKRDTSPKRLGAPDFRINHTKTHTVIGYIENKKIDANLKKAIRSKQVEKYQKLTDNLILTDYLEWIWLYQGDVVKEARLCTSRDLFDSKGTPDQNKVKEVFDLIVHFLNKEAEVITTAPDLAQKLARPSIEVKKYLLEQIVFQLANKDKREDLYGLFEIFRTGLFESLTPKEFADGFAQMLTYTLFLAKLGLARPNEKLSLRNARDHIGQAFSLIKNLVRFLDLLAEDKHRPIRWAVENILSIINNISVRDIVQNLSDNTGWGDVEKDAYIYFYEDFLREYDQEMRVDRGVYYTPPAVVDCIVTEVSSILKEDFDVAGGIANGQVKLLDFACGTGTFLLAVFKQVLSTTRADSFERNQLIENHLLKNCLWV